MQSPSIASMMHWSGLFASGSRVPDVISNPSHLTSTKRLHMSPLEEGFRASHPLKRERWVDLHGPSRKGPWDYLY